VHTAGYKFPALELGQMFMHCSSSHIGDTGVVAATGGVGYEQGTSQSGGTYSPRWLTPFLNRRRVAIVDVPSCVLV
jgi:hypothetical protein